MKRGVLGVPTDSSTVPLRSVESDETEGMGKHGNELTAALSVLESRNLYGDVEYFVGEGFKDREKEVDRYHTEGGSIKQKAKHVEVVQDYGEFVARPATDEDDHRGFVLTSSGEGTFLFPMIGRQNGITVERAEIRLGEWVRDHADLTATTAGGRTSSFEASKMTAWGDDVLDDETVQDLLGRAVEANALNQVAGEYVYDGVPYHITLAASGYAEVYSPNDLTTEEFLRWISAEIVPYATEPEEDDE